MISSKSLLLVKARNSENGSKVDLLEKYGTRFTATGKRYGDI
jgi:hypothetical protein